MRFVNAHKAKMELFVAINNDDDRERALDVIDKLEYLTNPIEVVKCVNCQWCKVCNFDGERYYSCDYEGGLYGDVSPTGFCYRGVERHG